MMSETVSILSSANSSHKPDAEEILHASTSVLVRKWKAFLNAVAIFVRFNVQERLKAIFVSGTLVISSLLLVALSLAWGTVAFRDFLINRYEWSPGAAGGSIAGACFLAALMIAAIARSKLLSGNAEKENFFSGKDEEALPHERELELAGAELVTASKDLSLAAKATLDPREWVKDNAATVVASSLAIGAVLGWWREEAPEAEGMATVHGLNE